MRAAASSLVLMWASRFFPWKFPRAAMWYFAGSTGAENAAPSAPSTFQELDVEASGLRGRCTSCRSSSCGTASV